MFYDQKEISLSLSLSLSLTLTHSERSVPGSSDHSGRLIIKRRARWQLEIESGHTGIFQIRAQEVWRAARTCNVHRPLQRNWIPAAVRESDDDDVMTKFSGRSSTPMKTGQLYQVLPAERTMIDIMSLKCIICLKKTDSSAPLSFECSTTSDMLDIFFSLGY